MKLEQSFEVAAPLERVWQALIDVEHVAPCLPGAAVTGRNEDGSYNGSFTVKIGPTTASYTGKLEMEEVDESGHRATMNAQGTDKRGQGGATAKILSKLEPVDDGRTRVSVDTDYRITGRLARFGRGGMIEDISERLLREFAERLQASLEGAPEDEAPTGETAAVADDTPAEGAPDTGVAEAWVASEPASGDEPAPLVPDEAAAPTDEGDAPESPPTEAPEPPPPPPPTDAAPPPPPPPTDAPAPPAPPAPSEPLDAGALVGSVLLDRIRANPWPWIAGALVLWRLLRRRR
jgi:carbon monoxide dehydrogenase subunit G